MMKKLDQIDLDEVVTEFDPIQRIIDKKGWKTEKKHAYYSKIVDHFTRPYITKKVYESFVKSG